MFEEKSTVNKHGHALCKKDSNQKIDVYPQDWQKKLSLRTDKIKTWNFKHEKNYEQNPTLLLSLLLTKHWF